MSKKLTIEEVRNGFSERGWVLLDVNYNKAIIPLAARCPSGHETTISWCNLKAGQGCRVCAGKEAFTYQEVRAYFREHGCELMSDTYVNSGTPLEFRCTCGTRGSIRFSHFKKGHRCQNCKQRKLSEANSTPESDLCEFCESKNCKLLETWMNGRHRMIRYVCSCTREATAYWGNFKNYPNCWECSKVKKSGDKCHLWNPDREQVALNKKYQKRCGNLLARCMKATGQKKLRATHETLGYTPSDLQRHIEAQLDESFGDDWHIDHIFPVKAFLDHGVTDLKVINALDNLRPLPGPENLSKGDQYDKREFQEWLGRFTEVSCPDCY